MRVTVGCTSKNLTAPAKDPRQLARRWTSTTQSTMPRATDGSTAREIDGACDHADARDHAGDEAKECLWEVGPRPSRRRHRSPAARAADIKVRRIFFPCVRCSCKELRAGTEPIYIWMELGVGLLRTRTGKELLDTYSRLRLRQNCTYKYRKRTHGLDAYRVRYLHVEEPII